MDDDKKLDALKASLGLPDTPKPQVINETFSLIRNGKVSLIRNEKDNNDNNDSDPKE